MKQNYEIPAIAFSSLPSYKFICVHRRLIILARTSLQRENL
ncbi:MULTISPECIES: hypothetical protein [Nostocaceae]|nr:MULTISPECIES: hypothetical protein [Nostocaceae]